MTENKDNNIVQFPKLVQVNTLWNEGLFGITVDTVKKVTINGSSVYIWFDDSTEERPWDLSLEYGSEEAATESYHEFMNAMRQIRFKLVDK